MSTEHKMWVKNLKFSNFTLKLQKREMLFEKITVGNMINNSSARGISLVEIMLALTLGIILSISLIGVYIAQKNTYKTNVSQASIQNSESAITALVAPTIRSAGFSGCTSLIQAISNLNGGGSPPIGTLDTTPSMIRGYDAAAGTTLNITQHNADNSSQSGDWTSGLDASLTGNVQATSDVLVVLGETPGTQPVGVITIDGGATSFTVQNASGIAAGQFGAVSDCLKASVFQVTSVAGNTISHGIGVGALGNSSNTFIVNYATGAQFVPLTQTAFFVAKTPGGESALMRATLNSDGSWSIQSLAPGVETMQVLYGIGTNGIPTQYVPASAVTNWGQVYAVRLGFLLEGQQGSGTKPPSQFTVVNTTVNVQPDTRLRHVYELTINIRNAS